MSLLALIGAELAVIVVAGLWFIVAAVVRPSVRDPVWWHLVSLAAVGVAEAFTLLLALTGVRLPLWPFAVTYGLADVVVMWRLVLLYWARRADGRSREPAK